MKKSYLLLIILISLQSCNYFTIKNKAKGAVARVNDSYLYKEDLKNIFNPGISKKDSISLAQNFINNWIKQQLLLDKAQLNIDNTKFDELVKKYRADLYINAYKEAVVEQYLDTVISSEEIDKYYEQSKDNFLLPEDLLQLKFMKLSKNDKNKDKYIKLFKSSKTDDIEELKSSKMLVSEMHLNDSVWVNYNNLIEKVPILKTIDKQQLLKKGNFIQKEDSLSLYLVAVKNVLLKNETAPESYLLSTIKQLILHQRKLLLLKNIEETLVNDATKKQQIEIY